MKRVIKKLLDSKKKKDANLPMRTIAAEGAIRINELSDADIKERMKRIDEDFIQAFKLLRDHPDTVTFFGSSVLPPSSKYYRTARELAKRIVKELHLTIVSGGGPGIMEAGNRGAVDAKGDSVGMSIELPKEQVTNKYATHSADFYYFFSRKVALTFTARAYIYFPGGFGTLDELFEIITLKQTGKIPAIPIILVGVDYWSDLQKFIEDVLYKEVHTIDKEDMELYTITDDLDEVLQIIGGTSQRKL
jgi:uncharacterized protein (TIGR00730 family)